jgi:ribosomal protein S18 acetylase RimI-like enzyme
MIRFANQDDLPAVIAIHSVSLENDLLPKLGKKTMQAYYTMLLKDHFIIVYEEGNWISGFLALTVGSKENKKFFFQNLKLFLVKFIQHPNLLMETIWMAFSSRHIPYKYPEISFIAIDRPNRSLGIGSTLISFACRFLLNNGFKYLQVRTDSGNPIVNQFYKKNKFVQVSTEKRFNRILNIYLREV